MVKINGYMIVRKPHVDVIRPGAISPGDYPPRRVAGIWYQGCCRLDWPSLVVDFYKHRLPPDMHTALDPIMRSHSDGTCLALCRDYDVARALLVYSNREVAYDELIALYSERLSAVKGDMFASDGQLELIGYDLILLPVIWPLLADGYFLFPTEFEGFRPFINKNGLFNEDAPIIDYFWSYVRAAERGITEPLPFEDLQTEENLELMAVYRERKRG